MPIKNIAEAHIWVLNEVTGDIHFLRAVIIVETFGRSLRERWGVIELMGEFACLSML